MLYGQARKFKLFNGFLKFPYLNSIVAAAEESQLIWFENPGLDVAVPNWNAHIIYRDMVDISFRIHEFPLPDNSSTTVVIGGGFYR